MEASAAEGRSRDTAKFDYLMARYQQGDPVSTADLIRNVTPLLYRFLAAEGGARPDVEDLLQETWLQVHRARHTWRPSEPVLPWLYAIARHVKVDSYRKRQRTRLHEQPVSVLPERPAPSHDAPRHLPDFKALLGSLPESQREVVMMLKLTGMSVEEVARATASTAGSVKLKAHRAYETLRRLLGVSNRQKTTPQGGPQ